MKPKISVIVPCYDQAQYLDECLHSVWDQTFKNWECIIVNDGSPDNTEEIAQKWIAKDSRFKYLYKSNGGLSSARNTGIESAVGEWILPLDSDDKISHSYLEMASKEFDKGYTLIYCEASFFGDKMGKWEIPKFNFEQFLVHNQIFCSSFFKKENWSTVGGYDVNMKSGYEDWEFFIRLLSRISPHVFQIKKTCFYYRRKDISMLNSLTLQNEKKIKEYIFQKHTQLYHQHFGSFIDIMSSLLTYKVENLHLKKILKSKRFQLFKKITSILDKFNIK